MTVASGAPSLMPMAAPNPQPRWPAGGVLNNEPGRLSGRTSASRDVTASLTIIVLSSIRSPMHLESHTGLMGVWVLTASMLASTSRTIASCSTRIFLRRSSNFFFEFVPVSTLALIIPFNTGSAMSEQPATARSAEKPQIGIEVNNGSRSR